MRQRLKTLLLVLLTLGLGIPLALVAFQSALSSEVFAGCAVIVFVLNLGYVFSKRGKR